MSNEAGHPVPRQRTKDLVVRSHDEGTLVLDRRTNTVHYLPVEVTRVWGACNGTATLAEIASVATIDEQAAASALHQLIELDLLEATAGIDRRKFLGRSALVGAGALAVGAIETVGAAPAWAQGTGPIVEPEPATLACSPALNTGGNRTTVSFQVRLLGAVYLGPGYYTITITGNGQDIYFRYGGSGTISTTAVFVVNATGNPPTGISSTIYATGPPTAPPPPFNGAPLPPVINITATICPTGNTPGGTPIADCTTENFSVPNPCCAPPPVGGQCAEPSSAPGITRSAAPPSPTSSTPPRPTTTPSTTPTPTTTPTTPNTTPTPTPTTPSTTPTPTPTTTPSSRLP